MITRVYIYNGVEWQELKAYNTAVEDERLDEQLDSGSVQIISESIDALADYSMFKVIRADNNLGERETFYYGFDTVEKRMGDYYIHSIELVEPTRVLMGTFIDGRAVVQPINSTKHKLSYVLSHLLETASLVTFSERKEFRLASREDSAYDEKVNTLLGNTESPEFYWQAQTSLWECLCDIGNVINCIPRLTANSAQTKFDTIYFESINDITETYEI